MTLPLWVIIGITLLATLGIYMTLKVVKRDVTIIEMDAHIQGLMQERDILEAELDEWEAEYKDVQRMKRMEGETS